jgi:hypothetical protein
VAPWPYPHPAKGKAWRENRTLCERLFFAGRASDSPSQAIARVEAVRCPPGDFPHCYAYKTRLLEWLQEKEREERGL